MAVRGGVRPEEVRLRIKIAFALVALGYGGLIARLYYLQGIHGERLYKEALESRRRHVPLPPRRGTIFDRNAQPLAISNYAGVVSFDPGVWYDQTTKTKDPRVVENWLQQSITQAAIILKMPREEVATTVEAARQRFDPKAKKPLRFVQVKKDVPLETADRLETAFLEETRVLPNGKSKTIRRPLLGFDVVEDSRREYAAGAETVHLVGYMGESRETGAKEGVAGLERSGAKWLQGTPGEIVAEVDHRSRVIPETMTRLSQPKNGLDIHTTLDTHIQHIVTQAAQQIDAKHHPAGISIVVVDPMAGDVLAMVSYPNFNPNPPRPHKLADAQFIERCAESLYEPGSTVKSLTLAAALEKGVISEGSWLYCGGQLNIGKRPLRCDAHGGSRAHGSERPIDILRHSCNVGAAQVGLRLGSTGLHEAFTQFGLFDSPFDADQLGLPHQQRGRSYEDGKNNDFYTNSTLARIAFGHSMMATPLNLAMAYSSLVNGGNLMKARLVTQVTNDQGKVVQEWKPQIRRRVLSERTSNSLCTMLREVVANGTGKVAALPGYIVGGKTGTARKYRRSAYLSSFAGAVPLSPGTKPRAVILVSVDEPQNAFYGSEVAAPAFQQIASRLMDYWQVPKDDPNETQAQAAKRGKKH